MGCLPGGRELSNDCWEEARWAVPLPCCWCDCRNGGTVGAEASSRESLYADFKLLHRLLPSAIIHSRRKPHEADDGCLACGSSILTVLWDNSKTWIFENGGTLSTFIFIYFYWWLIMWINVKWFTSLVLSMWRCTYMDLRVASHYIKYFFMIPISSSCDLYLGSFHTLHIQRFDFSRSSSLLTAYVDTFRHGCRHGKLVSHCM